MSRNSIAETQDTQALQTTVAITTQDNTWVPYSQSVLDVIGKAQIAKGVAYTPVTHDADEIQNQSPLKVTCECGISMGECNLVSDLILDLSLFSTNHHRFSAICATSGGMLNAMDT